MAPRIRLAAATAGAVLIALSTACSPDDSSQAQPASSSSPVDVTSGSSQGSSEPSASQSQGQGGSSSAPESAASTSAPAASASTPVNGGGDINETEAAQSVETKSPVPLEEPVDYGDGVSAKVSGIESVSVEAQGPGEISGPGARLTVEITNGGAAPISLDGVVVDLVDSTGAPAGPITSGGDTGLAGSLAPGQQATGSYLFSIPADLRNPVTIYLSYASGEPVAVLQGAIG